VKLKLIAIIVAAATLASAGAVLILDPLFIYRLQVPSGCVGVLIDGNILSGVPGNKAFARVSLFAPGLGERSLELAVPRGGRAFDKLCLGVSLNEAVKKFRDFEDRLKRELNVSELPARHLPSITIYVTVFGDGVQYIASTVYSAYDYFKEAGLPDHEASRRASEDPFAFMRGMHIIVVDSRRIKFSAVNLTAFEVNLIRDLKKAGVRVAAPWEPLTSDRVVEEKASLSSSAPLIGPVTVQAQSCPEFMTAVWNQDLFDVKDSPPPGWYSKLDSGTDDRKAALWKAFAQTFSVEYWWRTDRYSLDDAVYFTARDYTGFEGIYYMSSYIRRLAVLAERYGYIPSSAYYRPGWVDTADSVVVFKTIDVPAGYVFTFYDNKPLSAAFMLNVSISNTTVKGFTFFGICVAFCSYSSISMSNLKIAFATPAGFIYTPTAFVYVGDGIAIKFTVRQIESSVYPGCRYWVIRPYASFIPVYTAYPFIDRMYKSVSPPSDEQLTELGWSATYEQIFEYQTYDTIPMGSTIFSESSTSSKLEECGGVNLAGLLLSVVKSGIDIALAFIPATSPWVSVLFFMIDFIAHAISYQDFQVLNQHYNYLFELSTSSAVDPPTTIYIYKLTMRNLVYDYWRCQYLPLTMIYKITVYSTPPGSPPPGKYYPIEGSTDQT